MMPPPDCRRLLASFSPLKPSPHFVAAKLAQLRDRFGTINEGGYGRKRRILITQTTIKPSRFVTFLIYFASAHWLGWLFFLLPFMFNFPDEGKIKFNYMFEKSAISVMQNQTKERNEATMVEGKKVPQNDTNCRDWMGNDSQWEVSCCRKPTVNQKRRQSCSLLGQERLASLLNQSFESSFSEWVCIIIVQHTQTNRSSRHFFSNFEDRTTTTAEEKEKSQNVINDVMRNRGAWFRAVTESAQRHSLKYKRSSTRNERRSIAKCLAWDYETMRRQRNDRECLLGRSQTDAHGGSLVARLKFHSFHFMVFNQLHRIFSSLSRSTRSEENQWKPAKARKWDTE